MVCYFPLKGWQARQRTANGKIAITFKSKDAWHDKPMQVPCGQCTGCRLQRSRDWAIRIVHEASLYSQNSFITLTYAPEHLPHDGSLNVKHFQKFMKRLRKKYGKVRFFHCGEYGEKYRRPHYHAILFGLDFDDKILFNPNRGNPLYISEKLSQLWPYGYVTIGNVTFESAAYVARYCMKKVTGKKAELTDENGLKHYEKLDSETGEVYDLRPEYTTMSRRPGIAHDWYQQYKNDVFPHDEVIHKGRKLRPPRYYDNLYEQDTPWMHEKIKKARKLKFSACQDDNTDDRLLVKWRCKEAQLKQLERNLGKG